MKTTRRIVLTGGPSAGKTSLLNLLKNDFREAISTVPESASLLFQTGHTRPETYSEKIETQKKIYILQKELESQAQGLSSFFGSTNKTVVCDRGTLDGSAYWPGSLNEFCFAMGTSLENEFARYSAVIHLETPELGCGYQNTNIRTETAEEAKMLDQKIARNWGTHPNYLFVPNQKTFEEKLNLAVQTLIYMMGSADSSGTVRIADLHRNNDSARNVGITSRHGQHKATQSTLLF